MTGREIRRLRLKRGLSQEELARLVGVTPTTISRWERERNAPRSRAHIRALAKALGIKPRVP